MLWVPIRPARARLRPAANYAILQLCRVAANHVAQFSNGSCRFGPATSAMKTSAIISVITRLLSLGRSCRSSARLGLGSGSSTRPVGLLHKFGIQWTRCNFGGRRPWFICQCGKRVAKLYDTGSIVACRHCLDTIYESQRRGENGRKYLRACRIRLSIGGAPTISRDFPERPWRMHRKNYERIRIKAKKLEEPLRTNPHFRAREPDYTCHCFQ